MWAGLSKSVASDPMSEVTPTLALSVWHITSSAQGEVRSMRSIILWYLRLFTLCNTADSSW